MARTLSSLTVHGYHAIDGDEMKEMSLKLSLEMQILNGVEAFQSRQCGRLVAQPNYNLEKAITP